MAGTNWQQTDNIETDLLDRSSSFSFFQSIRLLNSFASNRSTQIEKSKKRAGCQDIRISPNLSLSFPRSGVEKIEKDENGRYSLTSNLAGLYGTGSPLPTFYTEELFEDVSRGETTTKEFMDVINQRLYELLFAGWNKYRSMQVVVEEKNKAHTDRLYSLIGLSEEELRSGIEKPYQLLRYTGLLTIGPRSASGLETLLKDALGNIDIAVEQAVERTGRLPEDQMPILGKTVQLGINSQLGSENKNCTGAFKIVIGPVSDETYRKFLPGETHYNELVALTKLYLSQPLEYEIEMILDQTQKPETLCLGNEKCSRLGLDTWIYSDEGQDEYRSTFYPGKAA